MQHQSRTRSTHAFRFLRPLALAAAITLGTLPAMTASAQSAPAFIPTDGTLLNVSAQAEAKRVPDIATLSTGVVTQAADANAAMRANAEQMNKVVAAIRAAGIAERDIQTSGVNLSPQYKYGENQPPTITGYQASNTVNITVRDIGKLGKILDALVAVGANQINGPSFDIDDKKKDEAYDEARRAAVAKAQARAEMYAKTLGVRVRRIVSISEGSGFRPPMPMPMMAMAKMDRAESTPISPGESTLSVNLDVMFELGK
ncbi:SIMPL domain-containing protein [Lysobacter niastensis]|uniref:SIMPL domain-containing protein n=1 Tax=Lysobacter niastensis TaxID=380629 RepID=A0ABS0B331_9GAMM|nr:SIMPL domain-containing protein [Lysobacter niastensis]MBF6022887.1 SIMPL domain-containing protein [Lysobacter niastensis]